MEPTGFQFRRKTLRLDWKKLASVDVDAIAGRGGCGVDHVTLQQNLRQVIYCDAAAEFPSCVDVWLLKLFRLSQLVAEYLLQCQDLLSTALTTAQHQLTAANTKLEKGQCKLRRCEKELRKLRRVNAENVDIMQQNKCDACGKVFVSMTFLHAHMLRRHADSAVCPDHQSVPAAGLHSPSAVSGPAGNVSGEQVSTVPAVSNPAAVGSTSDDVFSSAQLLDQLRARLSRVECELQQERVARSDVATHIATAPPTAARCEMGCQTTAAGLQSEQQKVVLTSHDQAISTSAVTPDMENKMAAQLAAQRQEIKQLRDELQLVSLSRACLTAGLTAAGLRSDSPGLITMHKQLELSSVTSSDSTVTELKLVGSPAAGVGPTYSNGDACSTPQLLVDGVQDAPLHADRCGNSSCHAETGTTSVATQTATDGDDRTPAGDDVGAGAAGGGMGRQRTAMLPGDAGGARTETGGGEGTPKPPVPRRRNVPTLPESTTASPQLVSYPPSVAKAGSASRHQEPLHLERGRQFHWGVLRGDAQRDQQPAITAQTATDSRTDQRADGCAYVNVDNSLSPWLVAPCGSAPPSTAAAAAVPQTGCGSAPPSTAAAAAVPQTGCGRAPPSTAAAAAVPQTGSFSLHRTSTPHRGATRRRLYFNDELDGAVHSEHPPLLPARGHLIRSSSASIRARREHQNRAAGGCGEGGPSFVRRASVIGTERSRNAVFAPTTTAAWKLTDKRPPASSSRAQTTKPRVGISPSELPGSATLRSRRKSGRLATLARAVTRKLSKARRSLGSAGKRDSLKAKPPSMTNCDSTESIDPGRYEQLLQPNRRTLAGQGLSVSFNSELMSDDYRTADSQPPSPDKPLQRTPTHQFSSAGDVSTVRKQPAHRRRLAPPHPTANGESSVRRQ